MTCDESKNASVEICEMQIKGQPCLWSIRRENYSFSLSMFFCLERKGKKKRSDNEEMDDRGLRPFILLQ